MLGHSLRRRPNIKPTLIQCLALAGTQCPRLQVYQPAAQKQRCSAVSKSQGNLEPSFFTAARESEMPTRPWANEGASVADVSPSSRQSQGKV